MGSIPFTCSTSEQSPLCSDVFCLWQKRHPPAPLLLRFKPNPLLLGFGLGPPLRGGFTFLRGNIAFNRPLHFAILKYYIRQISKSITLRD